MDKFDKLKLASSSFGERLMTGGAQMSRMVSTKMKEILQAPTPESKIVDEATLETMEEPNWGLNLRICAMINSETFNGAEIVKAIKKKIASKNAVGQRLSLDLLETCTSNCEKVFSEVASEKVLDDMVRMIRDPRTDQRNRTKALQLIRAWGESDELMYLPVFRQTHLSLQNMGRHGESGDVGSPPMHQTLDSYVNQQPMAPPERYPLPDMDLLGAEDDTSPYSYGGRSVEEKKELLVVARNSLDLLVSILDSGVDPIPINDELTVGMLEKCKQSLPITQRIAETTTDDDVLLFEALNLHDELQQVISRCENIEEAMATRGDNAIMPGSARDDAASVKEAVKPDSPLVRSTIETESALEVPREVIDLSNKIKGMETGTDKEASESNREVKDAVVHKAENAVQ